MRPRRPCARRSPAALLALAGVLALLAAACDAGDEVAGEPAATGATEPGATDAMEEVAGAAASTLAWDLAQATVTIEEEGEQALTVEVADDLGADRRALRTTDFEELVVVDGTDVFVRSDRITDAAWAHFELATAADESGAAAQDLLLLPLTDSADVLHQLAEAQGAAQPAGGSGTYDVTLDVEVARDLVAGDAWGWLERYVDTGYEEVTLRVELGEVEGERAVRSVRYPLPTPADRGVRQDVEGGATPGFDDATAEDDDGDGAEEFEGAGGLRATIDYAPGEEAPAAPPDGDDVREAAPGEVADLLPWAPTAGSFR